MIKAVVFDWHEVLTNTPYHAWLDSLDVDVQRRKQLVDVVGRVDLGQITLEQLWEAAGKIIDTTPAFFRDGVFSKLEVNAELLDLIRRSLAERYAIGICSNISGEFLSIVLRSEWFEGLHFNAITASSTLGVLKPDASVYRDTLEQLKCMPTEAIFIDDSERNVIGARAIGMPSIVFRGNEQLVSDLKMLDLI
ncbi:HAD-IA family hydrolase [Candidatus Parcubacteria bacterium]|nr:HAD-IA family hydrolase [Candidatus Parcubacteria bacterium]